MGVRPVVMRLDVVEVARILERSILPVQLAHPRVNVGIAVTNGAQVAFEVPDINGVKTDLRIK